MKNSRGKEVILEQVRSVSDDPLWGLTPEDSAELALRFGGSASVAELTRAIAERIGNSVTARKGLLALGRGLVENAGPRIYRVQGHVVDLGERRCSCQANGNGYPRCWHYVAAVLAHSGLWGGDDDETL